MRFHRPALPRPAAAAAGLRSVSLQRPGFPLQPVRPAGARQRQGDRQLRANRVRSLLPAIQQNRRGWNRSQQCLQTPGR